MTNVYKQFNWIWAVASWQKQKGISAPQNLQMKTMWVWVWDVDWQTEGILCLLLRQVNLTAQINPTRQSGDTHTPNSAAVCTNSCVCVLAEADSDALLCSTASWRRSRRRKKKKRTRLSILFIVTLQDTERLSLHPAGAGKIWKWVLSVGGVCLHDCLQNWSRCTFSLLAYFSTSVSVCVWVSSLALVFYLHVNRTGPQRMSTHSFANPVLKNNHFVFVSSSGFSPPTRCFSPPAALPPFLFIQQLSTALILPAAQERFGANPGRP